MYDDSIETHETTFDLEAPLEFANLDNRTLVGVGAQMGGPICHRSKVLIYSKSKPYFVN
jgi:hypothetical protein